MSRVIYTQANSQNDVNAGEHVNGDAPEVENANQIDLKGNYLEILKMFQLSSLNIMAGLLKDTQKGFGKLFLYEWICQNSVDMIFSYAQRYRFNQNKPSRV